MSKTIEFKGEYISGTTDLSKVDIICVPSKPHYNEVDICIKEKGSMNLAVAQVSCKNSLSFEDRQKIGYEIQDRCKRLSHEEASAQFEEVFKEMDMPEGDPNIAVVKTSMKLMYLRALSNNGKLEES